MKEPHQIILRPVITEKSNLLKESHNQVVFEVARRANKIEVKQAIERLFDVKVLKVRMMNIRGKPKRWGRIISKRQNWKKAVVTLAEGSSIDFFEGM